MSMKKQDAPSNEFMLSYFPITYQRSFFEREASEKVFNAFLTLASAIIGGTLVLTSNQSTTLDKYSVILIALFIIFTLGFVTYERICSKSIASIRWMMRANFALKYFTEFDNELEKFVKPHRINELSETWWQSFVLKGGGLARIAATINTIPALGAAFILSKYFFLFDIDSSVITVLFVGLFTWFLHVQIWRKKIQKLQTIVSPTLKKS